ncbi:MAG TPA: hypothetical protein VFX96_02565 [Pyrinomonadaceae bacterium]|nr:hypothetical protein [Pyrinomonadaceae bacterium]
MALRVFHAPARAPRMLASLASLVAAACLCASGARAARAAESGAASAFAVGVAESVRPAGEVLVVLNEGMLDALLDAIVSQPNPPAFPLSKKAPSDKACVSEIMPARESAGRRTAVQFRDGRVTAVIAFRGTYEAPLVGCVRFDGWADSVFNLSFDQTRQALVARVEVREVQLRNVPPMLGGGITGLVQDGLDERVNPIEILRAEQLGGRVPATRGEALRLRAREVRHEVAGQELRLRIVYEIVQGD